MAVLVRSWLGLAALGAGLIHLAVAAGAPLAGTIIFALLGVAEATWAVAAFAGSAIPLPRVALIGLLVPTVAWVCFLVLGSGMHMGSTFHASSGMTHIIPTLPMLAGTILDLVPALWIALRLRSGRDPHAPDGPMPAPLPYLAGVFGGGLVVAVVTSNAMGGTLVGELARTTMRM